jgi:cysteine desulfurase
LTGDYIYLDHHSTTPCDPRVVQAMLPWWTDRYANPHSNHRAGSDINADLKAALNSIASCLETQSDRLVITSGATESNNLAITGFCIHPRQRRRKLVTIATEHPSVLDPMRRLAQQGFELKMARVDCHGRVGLDSLAELVDDETALVSIAWANHEIGTIQPIQTIADLAHSRGAALHTDATQAIGRVPVRISQCGADLVTGSAHKFYGPRGTGLLVVGGSRRRIRIHPLVVGGGQQSGLRSGTMNVPGVMGMQTALQIATESMESESGRIAQLRDDLWSRLCQFIPGLQLSGPEIGDRQVLSTTNANRLAGNLNFVLPAVEGESLMAAVSDVAMSTGSACSSVNPEPSQVLLAIGLTESAARRSIRIGVGRFNSPEEIQRAARRIGDAYHKLVVGG